MTTISKGHKSLVDFGHIPKNGINDNLHEFLCSKWGRGWKGNFEFAGGQVLNCSQETMPNVEVLAFQVQHRR